MSIDRREAVRRIALLLGGTVTGGSALLRAAVSPTPARSPAFSDRDRRLLDEVGETIVPATSTPGAKAVGIGPFMAAMVDDCYREDERAVFIAGLADIDQRAQRQYRVDFIALSPADKTALCNQLDAEQRAAAAQRTEDSTTPPHYFRMLKELTLLGYFSSEVGATQVVRYIEVPGRYEGDVPYHAGQPAWF